MAKFSERLGFKPIRETIQIESMDEGLRNSLWSSLILFYWKTIRGYNDALTTFYYLSRSPHLESLCERLWLAYFKNPLDTLSNDWEKVLPQLRSHFFESEWFEVYDFIEFVALNYPNDSVNDKFINDCNKILERELAGYRFIKKQITPIITDTEISAIEEALSTKFEPVNIHINRSLQLLSDRHNPDFRNSIKEAISAVEALSKVIAGNDKATLGSTLKELEKKNKIHPAMREAFKKLYGYTSDSDGIRHALLEEDRLNFDQAKFMLVACSAFINFVISQIMISGK